MEDVEMQDVEMERCGDAKVSTRAHVHMGGYFCFLFSVFILHYIASAFAALDITIYDRIGYVHYYVSEQ